MGDQKDMTIMYKIIYECDEIDSSMSCLHIHWTIDVGIY